MTSNEDVHKEKLIQKPLIVRLDESHREYNKLSERVWIGVNYIYVVVVIECLFVAWGLVKVRSQLESVAGYLRQNSQQLAIFNIDLIGLQSSQGVLAYQTFSWWLMQILILALSTLLFYKIRLWLKQLEGECFKLSVIVILALGVFLLVRDSLGKTIVSIISSKSVLLIVQIEHIIQQTQSSIPHSYDITSTTCLQQQLAPNIQSLNNTAYFFSHIFDIYFVIDTIIFVLFIYQYFILYRTKSKCNSLINQLKQQREFDIIVPNQQYQDKQLHNSSTNSNNHKYNNNVSGRKFHQDMNSTHYYDRYNRQYQQQQTQLSKSSSSHSHSQDYSDQLYTLKVIKQTVNLPLVRWNSIGGEKNYNKNKNIEMVQFKNGFNSNHNLHLQPNLYRTNSSNSIGKYQQMASFSSFRKPNQKHYRTKTYQRMPFVQENQIKAISKSYTCFYDQPNIK